MGTCQGTCPGTCPIHLPILPCPPQRLAVRTSRFLYQTFIYFTNHGHIDQIYMAMYSAVFLKSTGPKALSSKNLSGPVYYTMSLDRMYIILIFLLVKC